MFSSISPLRRALICALIAGFAFSWSGTADAGVITVATQFGPNAGTGPGLGTVAVPAIVTTAQNNDNSPTPGAFDNNIVVPIKRFDFNDYIDIEFSVTPTQGVTEYQFFESVDNNTGVTWKSFTMILGYGVGANFVQSTVGDGLDFDFPNYDLAPTSSALPIVGTPNEDTLIFSGGFQGTGAETYQFRIDVPDVTTLPPGFGRFTLRQLPQAVPEPATLTLASLVLAGATLQRCRRTR
jgi:hypothetical protein